MPQIPDPEEGHVSRQNWAQDPGLHKAGPVAKGCAHRDALISDLGLEGLRQLVKLESPAVGGEAHVGRAR